ncbi:MAG: CDP-alcohol phosphatidyltransferase [Rhodospirillaceae bacterium]|nr:CDP-alcohol phosphatidyltransferase [Rhodospirillaceae bacterium]|tara:strand:+ start:681 stop:1283 length:603 start_codon:yes stop_codon:yes gene_type:complete
MSHNTWIHLLARTAVKPLVTSQVSPNHLTTVRLTTGLAAAGALGVGHFPWPDVGAALFIFSMLMDRADGELARQSGKSSPKGHKYDLIADCICNALIFVGLGASLRDSPYGYWAILMGIVAGIGVTAVFFMVMRLEKNQGEGAAELQSYAKFDPDDAMLVVPIAIWCGWSTPLLLSAVIGAPVFAIIFYGIYRRRNLLSS